MVQGVIGFMKSKKILYSTSYLISISCWVSLASREAVLVTLPVRKTCRMVWNWIAAVRQRLNTPVLVFQRTSINWMPRKYPLPFGIRATVYQAHFSTR